MGGEKTRLYESKDNNIHCRCTCSLAYWKMDFFQSLLVTVVTQESQGQIYKDEEKTMKLAERGLGGGVL